MVPSFVDLHKHPTSTLPSIQPSANIVFPTQSPLMAPSMNPETLLPSLSRLITFPSNTPLALQPSLSSLPSLSPLITFPSNPTYSFPSNSPSHHPSTTSQAACDEICMHLSFYTWSQRCETQLCSNCTNCISANQSSIPTSLPSSSLILSPSLALPYQFPTTFPTNQATAPSTTIQTSTTYLLYDCCQNAVSLLSYRIYPELKSEFLV